MLDEKKKRHDPLMMKNNIRTRLCASWEPCLHFSLMPLIAWKFNQLCTPHRIRTELPCLTVVQKSHKHSPSLSVALVWKHQYFLPTRLWFSSNPVLTNCFMCVSSARSNVPCPARSSNQTMDLLLSAQRRPDYPESIHFPSRPNPPSQERWARG